jgi:translation initiation factor 3 subunit C
MSSRFFRGGSSDSDTETSSDESVYSEEEQEVQAQGAVGGRFAKTSATRSAFSRFLRDEADSDDSDDNKRVVKSAKDKLLEDWRGSVAAIEAAKKEQDWVTIESGE